MLELTIASYIVSVLAFALALYAILQSRRAARKARTAVAMSCKVITLLSPHKQ